MKRSTQKPRRGLAAIWAVVVLAAVSGLGLCLVARVSMVRKDQERELARDQADWLARSGQELAIDRLLAKKADYKGETVSPITGSEVKIKVSSPQGKADVYLIECDVRYKVVQHGIAVAATARRSVKIDASGKVEAIEER